jgi:hypothetical protein
MVEVHGTPYAIPPVVVTVIFLSGLRCLILDTCISTQNLGWSSRPVPKGVPTVRCPSLPRDALRLSDPGNQSLCSTAAVIRKIGRYIPCFFNSSILFHFYSSLPPHTLFSHLIHLRHLRLSPSLFVHFYFLRLLLVILLFSSSCYVLSFLFLDVFTHIHLAKMFGKINPLKPSGKNMYHLFSLSLTVNFAPRCLLRVSEQTAIISLNSINQLIFIIVKCGVLFEVRTGFLNIVTY